MTRDRRRQARDTPDRRSESRRDAPLWAYLLAIAMVAVLFTVFWNQIYG